MFAGQDGAGLPLKTRLVLVSSSAPKLLSNSAVSTPLLLLQTGSGCEGAITCICIMANGRIHSWICQLCRGWGGWGDKPIFLITDLRLTGTFVQNNACKPMFLGNSLYHNRQIVLQQTHCKSKPVRKLNILHQNTNRWLMSLKSN